MRKLLANKNPDSAQTSNVRGADLTRVSAFALAANDSLRERGCKIQGLILTAGTGRYSTFRFCSNPSAWVVSISFADACSTANTVLL